MNFLIAEDEAAARKNLVAILKEVEPDCNILAVLESVEETAEWIATHPAPDIGFFDIKLSDTIIFELFRKTEIKFPVVFVTAYNQYALRAFKVNSIDYILKPVSSRAVRFALKKYKQLTGNALASNERLIKQLMAQMEDHRQKAYRKSILLNLKDKLIPVAVNDIACFFIESGMVYCMTSDGKKYFSGGKLEEFEKQLDPERFFRANRQYIVARNSVREISPYFNERLIIRLSPPTKEPLIISKARASEFKGWIVG